jgi:hypothetical protein
MTAVFNLASFHLFTESPRHSLRELEATPNGSTLYFFIISDVVLTTNVFHDGRIQHLCTIMEVWNGREHSFKIQATSSTSTDSSQGSGSGNSRCIEFLPEAPQVVLECREEEARMRTISSKYCQPVR